MSLAAATATAVAPASGELGVSLGIAGFLVAYLAGVVYMLDELGIIDGSTKMAGASSGALLTLAHCSGISGEQFMAIVDGLSAECRETRNCQGRLHVVLEARLRQVVPPGAYARCANKGYFSISVGRLSPAPRNLLVGDFNSNSDMVEAACASSFIPAWSGPSGSTTFRGQPSFDGFFSNAQPCPPGVKRCIKIASRNPPWTTSNPRAMQSVLGRAASAGHFKPARLSSTPPGGFAAAEAGSASPAQALAQAAGLGVDIAPGLFSATGLAQEAWDDLCIMPGDARLNRHLYALGRRDAKAWAAASGLPAAAAKGGGRARAGASLAYERAADSAAPSEP